MIWQLFYDTLIKVFAGRPNTWCQLFSLAAGERYWHVYVSGKYLLHSLVDCLFGVSLAQWQRLNGANMTIQAYQLLIQCDKKFI